MQPVLFGLDRRNHAGAIPGKGTPEQPRDSAINLGQYKQK